MSKKKPGSKYAIKLGRERYQKERAAYKAKLAARREREINDNDAT